MNNAPPLDDRIKRLIEAFDTDNYSVDPAADVIVYEGFIGMRATHKTAVIGTTGKKKKVYYIEGDPYAMGYLMGKLAEPEIGRMCTDFNNGIIFDFINWQIPKKTRDRLGEIIEDIINGVSQEMKQDVPKKFIEELEGMLDGCKEVNHKTHVDQESLWVLNVGIDALLSYIYTGILPSGKKSPFELKSKHFTVPIMCNGFAAKGTDPQTLQPYHFMGRDFMFPTADVYQDTATMIIRKPVEGNPTVSVAAPGMIGTVAGINSSGVGVGVDILPSANCNPNRAGVNSLLLTRWSIENGKNCKEAVDVMVNAQRGVSWIYILADGTTDMACIVEAGESTGQLDFLSYADDWVVETLEKVNSEFKDLLKNPSTPVQNGLMVRWNDYTYPPIYQTFNKALIKKYKKLPFFLPPFFKSPYKYTYNPQDFGERNYLNKTWKDKNCPGPYYFAPQRENVPSVTVVTNHCIIPEMRLCAMKLWTAIVAWENLNDIQWRYDELNNELLALCGKGYMTYDEAKETIDYLAPYHKFPDYYNKDRKPLDQVQICASVSIIDLKQLTIETHYGYFSDEWIKISLKSYID
jgi:hypothetical protein